ncbi:unnamed protein product [Plutella xylostella]|uniref:(diamondback moth) hypothetical protein n=1 Tax=Plutella xylostella TaxID=51655 RepID=A0A8S4G7Z1_PLUXY|nr:uncharacterized protein LOC105387678 [Plutella xylostella]CAG9135791.1 unnamed protein product [Plutella xylostella]
MDIEAKIMEDMRSLGCNSNLKIGLAFHLYIYLVDQKLMYDTEYCYNKDIDTLYIVARPTEGGKLNIYVPIPTSNDISLKLISSLQENLCTVETGPTVNLAFVEGDSTTVIYSFTKGLLDLQSPEGLLRRRTREERRNFIDNELRKNRDDILNNALNGGVVDDH